MSSVRYNFAICKDKHMVGGIVFYKHISTYPKYLDRQACANSVGQIQIRCCRMWHLIRFYTVHYSFSNFWIHHQYRMDLQNFQEKYGKKLRGIDALSREVTLSNCFCLSFEEGSILKGKNLLPLGANSFLLE